MIVHVSELWLRVTVFVAGVSLQLTLSDPQSVECTSQSVVEQTAVAGVVQRNMVSGRGAGQLWPAIPDTLVCRDRNTRARAMKYNCRARKY